MFNTTVKRWAVLNFFFAFKSPEISASRQRFIIGISNCLTINVDNNDAQSIYEFFLSPSNQFGENVMEKWKTHYTSNKQFIEDAFS